jgi:hypothetical protein
MVNGLRLNTPRARNTPNIAVGYNGVKRTRPLGHWVGQCNRTNAAQDVLPADYREGAAGAIGLAVRICRAAAAARRTRLSPS